jgi:hypothetical protein
MLKESVQKGSEGPRRRQPRYLSKQDLRKLRQESTGNVKETLRMTIGLEFVKRITRMSSMLWKMRNWTLWRGRPPPKWKEKLTSSISVRRAGKVGALVTLDSFSPPLEKRESKTRKPFG